MTREYNVVVADKTDTLQAADREVQPGDTYVFTRTVYSIAGVRYDPGDTLQILGRTEANPHNRQSSLGNLSVKCKYFTSVWTMVEYLIYIGTLKLISTKGVDIDKPS